MLRTLTLLLLLTLPAQAQPALYQCTTIVTGTDLRDRPAGFARCLTEVLVKLTAQPALRNDPRITALDPAALVQRFSYVDPRAGLLHHDDQGTYDRSHELTVRFDPAKVDAALDALGVPRWTSPRPVLVPILLVRNRDPEPFLLSAEAPRGVAMREALVRIAAEHGVGVRFPREADLAAWGVGLVGPPAPLGGPGPGGIAVPGTLAWNIQARGWVGDWSVRQDGADHDWGVRGVSYDDAFAAMVRGVVMLAAGTGTP